MYFVLFPHHPHPSHSARGLANRSKISPWFTTECTDTPIPVSPSVSYTGVKSQPSALSLSPADRRPLQSIHLTYCGLAPSTCHFHGTSVTKRRDKMLAAINRLLDWIKSLFWKEEMELTLVGLQNSGKTTFVNVIAVSCTFSDACLLILLLMSNIYIEQNRVANTWRT